MNILEYNLSKPLKALYLSFGWAININNKFSFPTWEKSGIGPKQALHSLVFRVVSHSQSWSVFLILQHHTPSISALLTAFIHMGAT